MRFLSGWVLLSVGVLIPVIVTAQDPVTLQGLVVDSLARPIPGVELRVAGTDLTARTGNDGQFRLVVPRGSDLVVDVTRQGFISRRFRVSLNRNDRGLRDVGTVVLGMLPPNARLLTGVVREMGSMEPISGVPVHLNGRTIAVTDSSGEFRVVAQIDSGNNQLMVERLGYETLQNLFSRNQDSDELSFLLELTPVAIPLSGIDVVGETSIASRRLAGFERRRSQGIGHFFNAEDIDEMNAVVTSDVIRRVPGVRVQQGGAPSPAGMSRAQVLSGATPDGTQTKVFLGRRATSSERPACQPSYYLDDVKLSNPDIDMLMQPGRLAGMEVYLPGGLVPAEYTSLESACGVVVMWSKDGMFTETGSPVAVGFHYGAETLTGRLREGRIGGHLVMQLFGFLEFNPGFSVFINAPEASRTTSYSGWQMTLNVRRKPFGPGESFYMGGGLSALRISERPKGDFLGGDTRPVRLVPMIMLGFAPPLGRARPFLEIHWMDVFHTGTWDGVVYSGVRFAVAK